MVVLKFIPNGYFHEDHFGGIINPISQSVSQSVSQPASQSVSQ